MEFPNINGNTTTYIVYTCTYDNIEFNRCYNDTYIGNKKYSFEYNNDLECLSNKCYKNNCMFNDETPIVHCDDIYSNKWYLQPSSYMYCGKPPGDICIENDECSSMSCAKNICQYQDDDPSDSDGGIAYIAGVLIIGGLIIIIIIIIIIEIITCCYCYKTKHKK